MIHIIVHDTFIIWKIWLFIYYMKKLIDLYNKKINTYIIFKMFSITK